MSDRELTRESILRNIPAGVEAWTEVSGFYQQSKEITIFERVYQEVLHRQCKCRLFPKFNSTGKQVLAIAPGPAKIRAGSCYRVGFAISVALDKYEFHLPLERQRQKCRHRVWMSIPSPLWTLRSRSRALQFNSRTVR